MSELTAKLCRTCGNGPRPEMLRDHPLFPWYASHIGPGAAWAFWYCSAACHELAEEHSAEMWRRWHRGEFEGKEPKP